MDYDPIAIVRACYQAYADSDRAAAEAVIAEDFHFTSPLDNRIDRETYFARCWPNHEWITAYEFIRLIRDGKIVEVEVYFGWSLPHRAAEGGFVE